MPSIIHTGDLHVDTCRHGRFNPATGMDVAMESNLGVVRHLVNEAIARDVDLFLVAGDAFSTGKPSPDTVLKLDDELKPLTEARIPVLFLEGNHERIQSALSNPASPISLMGRLAGSDPVSEVSLRHYESCDVLCIPYPSKPQILAALGREDADQNAGNTLVVSYVLDQVSRLLEDRDESIPLIITGHFTVDGIGLPGSEADTANLFSEPVFPGHRFDQFNPSYIGLSHIHTPQQVGRIHYAGSPNKLTMTDADDVKGGNLVDLGADYDTTSVTRLVTPARRLFKLRLDADGGLEDVRPDDVYQLILAPGEIDPSPEIRKTLRAEGARYIVKRTPLPKTRAARVVLPDNTTTKDAIAAYLAGRGHKTDEVQQLLALAEQIGVTQ